MAMTTKNERLAIRYSSRMIKNVRKMARRGKDISKMDAVINILADRKVLPSRYRDHALHGALEGCRECHIEPDWLLVYEVIEGELMLYAMDTGTHARTRAYTPKKFPQKAQH